MIKKTSWGVVAEWYDGLLEESADSFQARVIAPNLERIIDPHPGMSLLDVACGQGYFSRPMAAKGAAVTACDISSELIERASGRNEGRAIRYEVAPADDLGFAAPASFDAAMIVLAMQNIREYQKALSECARALKPGGRLVLVMNHPAFRIPKRSSWGWDAAAGSQYRRLDAYMSDSEEEIDMTPGASSKKRMTVSFHRPLQSYFKALNKAGLSVSRLEEWISHRKSQAGPRAAEEDRARKEFPMFVMIEARKQ